MARRSAGSSCHALLYPMTRSEANLHPASEFCRLCREGRLFRAEAWLKAGEPAQIEHKNIRCTRLGIAIHRGFHSLVHVLLDHGFAPTPNRLLFAVRKGHVGSLLQRGADLGWLRLLA